MTPPIAIFRVLVLLGCLHLQLARNPIGAKSSPDLLTRIRVGERRAHRATPDTAGMRTYSSEFATPPGPGIADCTSPYQIR
jgi:hypothetical protein